MDDFLHLFSFIFRLVLIHILYVIYYVSLVYLDLNEWWLKYIARNLFYVCNFRELKVKGYENYELMKNSDKKFLIVSNHISLYDGFVFLASLGKVGFLANRNGMMILCGMYDINKRLNSVFVDEGKTTKQIIEHVYKRKSGESPLVIFSDGMQPIPKNKNIASFKTGAFIGKFDILPVVIKYKNYRIDPTYRWYEGESPFNSFYKMILDDRCEINVEVLEPVSCGSLTVEEYKEKVYNIMDKRYSII